MQSIARQDIVATVSAATEGVFSTMLGLPLKAGEVRQGDEPATFDGVIALVGIGGSWTGSGRIYCGPEFACKIGGALLATEYPAVNEDVLDAVAEVANMIIGNVKTDFETRLGPLGLSVPTVIFGRNYHARSVGAEDWVVVPFHSGEDKMEIHFCLLPSRPCATQPRSEPVPA